MTSKSSNEMYNERSIIIKLKMLLTETAVLSDEYMPDEIPCDISFDSYQKRFIVEVLNDTMSQTQVKELLVKRYKLYENNFDFLWLICNKFDDFNYYSLKDKLDLNFNFVLIQFDIIPSLVQYIQSEIRDKDLINRFFFTISNKNDILTKKFINKENFSTIDNGGVTIENFWISKPSEKNIIAYGKTLTKTIKRVKKAPSKILTFRARIHFPHVAGYAHVLNIMVNGNTIADGNLLNKELMTTMKDGRSFNWFSRGNNSWGLSYSPDFIETYNHNKYSLANGDPYYFVFDISEYNNPNGNEVVFSYCELKSFPYKKAPVVINRIIIE